MFEELITISSVFTWNKIFIFSSIGSSTKYQRLLQLILIEKHHYSCNNWSTSSSNTQLLTKKWSKWSIKAFFWSHLTHLHWPQCYRKSLYKLLQHLSLQLPDVFIEGDLSFRCWSHQSEQWYSKHGWYHILYLLWWKENHHKEN